MLSHLRFTFPADGCDRLEAESSGLVDFIAIHHFRFPVDTLPGVFGEVTWLRERILSEAKSKWNRLYDLVELIAASWEKLSVLAGYDTFARALNELFEEESIGYRLHDRRIIPITNAAELRAISEASQLAAKSGLDQATEHLNAAIDELAARPEPNYRNCIKEAISAVEAVSSQLAGERKAALPKALGKLGACRRTSAVRNVMVLWSSNSYGHSTFPRLLS